MLSHLINHIHFTYELYNTLNYSIVFKIILTRRVSTVDLITILVALKGSYNCMIVQFIVHNLIHTSHLNTHVFQHPSHVQFITYSQFKSSFHNLNITISTKDFITTWGVKPLKQFLTIISKSWVKHKDIKSIQVYRSILIRTSIGTQNTIILYL